MKRVHEVWLFVETPLIAAGFILFRFFTHNIFDLAAFTLSNAAVVIMPLIITVIITVISYFPSIRKKKITNYHLLISVLYYLGWVYIAVKKSGYYSSLVDEKFISNETNLYLQTIIYGNLSWALVLIGRFGF